jgi:VanZ family protein
LLATLAWGRRGVRLRLFLGVIALGGLLELLQGFVGRDAAWLDQLANTVGALLGMGCALAWRRLVERPGQV